MKQQNMPVRFEAYSCNRPVMHMTGWMWESTEDKEGERTILVLHLAFSHIQLSIYHYHLCTVTCDNLTLNMGVCFICFAYHRSYAHSDIIPLLHFFTIPQHTLGKHSTWQDMLTLKLHGKNVFGLCIEWRRIFSTVLKSQSMLPHVLGFMWKTHCEIWMK